mmetsp:Transcript_31556/g.53354  ORF Transcript_31556/g.53354 Transcript_31556/m.53354 type:complete len:85 (-) Transcript_31556:852-1106(-)
MNECLLDLKFRNRNNANTNIDDDRERIQQVDARVKEKIQNEIWDDVVQGVVESHPKCTIYMLDITQHLIIQLTSMLTFFQNYGS